MTKQTLLFIAAIIFALPSLTFAEKTKIGGEITNAKGGDAVVYYSKSYLGREREMFRVPVDESGSFEMEIELDKARILTFSYAGEVASFYLKPQDELFIRLDTEEFDESLKYEGKGESAASSNFLAAYFLKFEDTEFVKEIRENVYEQTIVNAKKYMLVIMETQEKFILGYQQEKGLSEEFTNLVLDRARYNMFGNLVNLPEYRAYMDGSSIEELNLPDNYYDFLGKAELNKPSALDLPEYRSFVGAYINYKYSEGADPKANDEANKKNAIAKVTFKDEVLDFVRANMILEQLSYGSFTIGEGLLNEYKKEAKEDEELPYLDILQPVYDRIKPVSPGNLAPSIVLKDENGKEVSLEDFRGKVIYLDFWASWCGPCRREMPYARKLQKDFKGKDVVFLYVSVDDNEKAWRKAMEEENLDGVHLWSQGFRSEVPQSYMVNAIPNYFLIGKDGRIIENNPPRPSGPDLPKIINSYIDEN